MIYSYFKELWLYIVALWLYIVALWLYIVALWYSLARKDMGALGGTFYSSRDVRRALEGTPLRQSDWAAKKTFGIGKKL